MCCHVMLENLTKLCTYVTRAHLMKSVDKKKYTHSLGIHTYTKYVIFELIFHFSSTHHCTMTNNIFILKLNILPACAHESDIYCCMKFD